MRNDNFIEIRESKIEGIGVFAKKDFKKGDVIYSFKKGKILSATDVRNIFESEKRYIDKVGEEKFEIIEPPARYVNHSCDPNVSEKERIAYALSDIYKGEEITIDYDKIAYLKKPFECHCGSKNCRRFVRGKK